MRALLKSALAVSVGIEAIQYAERWTGIVRSVDIDDVILNLIGACVGYFAYVAVKWTRYFRE